MFVIRLGVPDMETLWTDLLGKAKRGTLGTEEVKLYKKMGKAMSFLSNDPKHPGLHSHEIEALSRRYGVKVWQPHPEDKKSAGYEQVRLSATGKEAD